MRPTSSAPTLSTPLVATLTAAAAGCPPSLAATVIAPQSCCVAAMPAQCGSIQRSAPTRTPFLERRILPIRRVWRHVCISLESRLNGPKAPKFPAARTSRLEFRGADRSPEGALPVLFLIPHGNGTLFHFFSPLVTATRYRKGVVERVTCGCAVRTDVNTLCGLCPVVKPNTAEKRLAPPDTY